MSDSSRSLLGIVIRKWYGPDSSHYVIRGTHGECEAHYSDIFTEAFRHLEVGDKVRYRLASSSDGDKAKFVVRMPDSDEDWLLSCHE